MAVFSVDSDAVLSATTAVRSTADRIQGDSQAMMSQLSALQSSWTGAASVGFQTVIDQWRTMQSQIEQTLGSIGVALGTAGQQYAEAEQMSASLFR